MCSEAVRGICVAARVFWIFQRTFLGPGLPRYQGSCICNSTPSGGSPVWRHVAKGKKKSGHWMILAFVLKCDENFFSYSFTNTADTCSTYINGWFRWWLSVVHWWRLQCQRWNSRRSTSGLLPKFFFFMTPTSDNWLRIADVGHCM